MTEDQLGGQPIKLKLDIDQTSSNVFWRGALVLEKIGSSFSFAYPNYPYWGFNNDQYFFGNAITADPNSSDPDNGSDASFSALIHEPGEYIIRVSDRFFFGVPKGATYDLHVSLENHKLDSFIFAPTPVLERESQTTDGQLIDDSSGWYTLHNPSIGDSDFNSTESAIDSSVAYTTVQGFGTGKVDRYKFTVTAADLRREPDIVEGTSVHDGEYYIQSTLTLNGPIEVGNRWIMVVDEQTYSFTVTSLSQTLSDVASALVSALPAKYNATSATNQSTGAVTLSMSNSAGYRLQNAYVNHVNAATVSTSAGSASVGFTSMKLDFTGSITGSNNWVLSVDGTDYSVSATTDVATTVAALRTALTNAGGFTVGGTGATITLAKTNSQSLTAVFKQSGISPVGRVTISGKPATNAPVSTEWTTVKLTLTPANSGETLTFTLNNQAYAVSGNASASTMATALKDALPSNTYTVTITNSSNSSADVTITRAAGFTYSSSVSQSSAQGTLTVTNSTWTAANLDLSVPNGATFSSSDVWTVIVDGAQYSASGADLATVGSSLATAIQSGTGFITSFASDRLTIRKRAALRPQSAPRSLCRHTDRYARRWYAQCKAPDSLRNRYGWRNHSTSDWT